MLVAYCRTSTAEQIAGLESQIRDLRAFGCERIFSEQVSSVAHREQLNAALAFIRSGDTLVCTKMDRLARSVTNLLQIVADLEKREIGLVVLSMSGQPLDTRTPTGRLLLTVLGAIAEFERGLILERQREGIAAAKEAGKYKGRKWTDAGLIDQAHALASQGIPLEEVALRTGVSRSALYRNGVKSSRYSASLDATSP